MDNPRFLSLGGGHPRHFLSSGGNLVNGDSCKIMYDDLFIGVYGVVPRSGVYNDPKSVDR